MSENIYFQDLEIDWRKAKQEHSLKKGDQAELETFLYEKQLRQLVSAIKETINSPENDDQSNKIFSVVGERGTGKSSFLKSFSKVMKADKKSNPEASFIDVPNMYILPKIDPILFDQSITIIEMLASMLDGEVKEKEKKLHEDGFGKDHLQIFVNFKKCLREVISILKNICKGESYFADKDSGIEVLKEIKNRQNFEKKIGEMFEKFLAIMQMDGDNYAGLLIRIDDLDLVTNKRIYHALNDLFKFVGNQKNVIVVMAYREEQLNNSVIDNLLADNQELLDQSFINQIELKRQAAKFLEKGLPKSNRLYLSIDEDTDIDSILRPYIKSKDIKKFDELKGNQTIIDFIQDQVMKTTRIMIDPIDSLENTSMTYPRSIRSTLQYLEKLHQLEKLNRKVDNESALDDKGKYFETIIGNLNNYREFLFSTFRENLINQDFYILDEWLNRNIESRNGYFVVALGEKIEEKIKKEKIIEKKYISPFADDEEPLTRINQICGKQTYNISLGDVYELMEYYKDYFKGSEANLYFIYAAKILYSIENLRLFLKSLVETSQENNKLVLNSTEENLFELNFEIWNRIFEDYLLLVHGKIMMDEFYYDEGIASNSRDRDNYHFVLHDKTDKLEKEILSKIVVSNTPARGDVYRGMNVRATHNTRNHGFQYRYQFRKYDNDETEEIAKLGNPYGSFKNTRNYGIDPYSFLTDMNYLSEVVVSIMNSNDQQKYFFYSMFDLDFFNRKNYRRSSTKGLQESMEYVLKRVNSAIFGKLGTSEEKDMYKKMAKPIIAFNKNYCEIYDDKFINGFCEKILVSMELDIEKVIDREHLLGKELNISDVPTDRKSAIYLLSWTYVNEPEIWNEASIDDKDSLELFIKKHTKYSPKRKNLVAKLWGRLNDAGLVTTDEE